MLGADPAGKDGGGHSDSPVDRRLAGTFQRVRRDDAAREQNRNEAGDTERGGCEASGTGASAGSAEHGKNISRAGGTANLRSYNRRVAIVRFACAQHTLRHLIADGGLAPASAAEAFALGAAVDEGLGGGA